jgi:phosphatidylglycerol---prolipoprotein diacylglyceryl transferase
MQPILFHIGSLTVRSSVFFITAAYIVSILAVLVLGRKQKLPAKELAAYLFFGVVICTIGSRLYLYFSDFFQNPSFYVRHPIELFTAPFFHGKSYYGAVLAGVFFSLWYLPKFHLPIWKVADIVGTGTALGFSIARIGCFLGGCCYGRPSRLPWAIAFPGLESPRHPTQLYESGLNFLSFLFLLVMLNRKKFDGQIICYDIIINSLARFFVEFYRGDPGRGYVFQGSSPYFSLSVPQLFALAGLASGMIVYALLRKKTFINSRT